MKPRDKRQVVEELLAKGDTMICLDSRHPGVQVPEHHKGKEDLRLVLNLNFRRSISTQPEGIQAELLFGGEPFLCWIPYESLWAAYNPQTGEGYLWPGQTPASLRDLVSGKKPPSKEGGTVPGKAPRRSPSRPREAPALSGPEGGGRKRRSRFRVIDGGKKG